ncbi:MAG TPA: HD domain-containing phosphohydrolase [Terriglobales bacterium]|nr:HD domain-containing phosphohydrolase [Terriglobales bacterium]
MTRQNFRRLLLTFGALSDLGSEITADRDFSETASVMLARLREALGAREGVLFTFSDKPAMLTSLAAQGFVPFPDVAMIPLLPKHVHALAILRSPVGLERDSYANFFTKNGNVAPELFRCLAPLRVGGKLVGAIALGRREDNSTYDADELGALALLSNYVAVAVQNHALKQSLEYRVTENLRLLGSIHKFYDNALEAFAAAIDIKHVSVHGHSLRVGRYAAAIAEAIGLGPTDISGIKAAGYLHDIGKVAVDNHIFSKPAALDAEEFREMADHTVVGHRIVSGVDFPWPKIPDVVRWHHERADGSGYPDHVRGEELPIAVRLISVADTFDAMTSERPYRHPLAVGETLTEIVRLTPAKFDPVAVQGLLVQVRRDAVGSNKSAFLDHRLVCNIGPTDVDQIASMLQHRLTNGRVYSC